jgi:hypothetical protein
MDSFNSSTDSRTGANVTEVLDHRGEPQPDRVRPGSGAPADGRIAESADSTNFFTEWQLDAAKEPVNTD